MTTQRNIFYFTILMMKRLSGLQAAPQQSHADDVITVLGIPTGARKVQNESLAFAFVPHLEV